MTKSIEIKVPDIGDFDAVPVIEILVSVGDTIEKNQALVVLESEKSTMEVPSDVSGTIESLKIKVGDKISEGAVIAVVKPASESEEEKPEAPAPKPEAKKSEKKASKPDAKKDSATDSNKENSDSDSAKSTKTEEEVSVKVPDIGDFDNIPVIEVLVSSGDIVEKDQALIVLESEKSTMEIPAPAAGKILNLAVAVGDKVSEGRTVCAILTQTDSASDSENPKPSKDKKETEKTDTKTAAVTGESPEVRNADAKPVKATPLKPEATPGLMPHASPLVRKVARQFGVDIHLVEGSGNHNRILLEDVQSFVKRNLNNGGGLSATPSNQDGSGLPSQPIVDFSKFGDIEVRPLARIRKLSAKNLHRNWVLVPHVTQQEEADITELEDFRKQSNSRKNAKVKLTLLPFLIKAVAKSMQEFEEFNSALSPDSESLIVKKYCNIGFAADTENGLVVPVVKDVWSKGLEEIASECAELAAKARDGKLKPDDMRGGCFSISSLGGIGGSFFTPIVNAPEVAILGVSRASMKPVWDGNAFQPRLICPLSLSYDHRVIDGAYAARFVVHLQNLLSDIRNLIL